MVRDEPILFKKYPALKGKVPWIPILTDVPTPVDRLTELENHLKFQEGEIYLKRDDKDHDIYGGNKLRKFEFIFADILRKKKKGVMTFGGIGTNHGLACALVAKNLNPPLKCDLFLALQPLTWHAQRSLLLFDYFGAKLHFSNTYGRLVLKSIFFRLLYPKFYLMLPGGSPLLGRGTPLGTISFINALFELKNQIDEGVILEPDDIFVACGSTGTAAGLIAGVKILGLKTIVHAVVVADELFVNAKAIVKNCNKSLKYLQKRDENFPKVEITEEDFEVVSGFLGSEYGVKTERGQKATDVVNHLEGKKKGFKLETTYTGKAMAALFEFVKDKNNKAKKVLFWNTYNSNDLDKYIREIGFNWKKLPRKFHQFYEETKFQCWQIKDCPLDIRDKCAAFLNHEYRCWKVKGCSTEDQEKCKAYEELQNVIELEDA